jgi:hypothetical protein
MMLYYPAEMILKHKILVNIKKMTIQTRKEKLENDLHKI